MSRIRTVKPELFKHSELFDAEEETGLPVRVAFIGLFTVADREGRFKWKPRELKVDVLPYDDLDFSRVLHALVTRGFIKKYTVSGVEYGMICTFTEHQVINNRETPSKLPDISQADDFIEVSTRESRVDDASATRHGNAQGEGKGKEGKGKEGNNPPNPPGGSKAKKSKSKNIQPKDLDYSEWPDMPTERTMIDWIAMRKRKRADVSQTVINQFAPELTKAVAFGYTVDQCMAECVTRNWQGFKFEWLQNSQTQPRGNPNETNQRPASPGKKPFAEQQREQARKFFEQHGITQDSEFG